MFFWQSLAFFDDPVDVGNLISCSSAFSKTSLNIWKFMVYILLKPALGNFEHFTCVWDECNHVVVWAFFGIAFIWHWNENWTFSSPLATAVFSKFADILSTALSQHHLLELEIAHLEIWATFEIWLHLTNTSPYFQVNHLNILMYFKLYWINTDNTRYFFNSL